MGILKDKRALITGVASNRSIAWGIASAMRAQGAELAFTYQNERLGGRVQKLAAELDSSICIECDVAEEGAADKLRDDLGKHWEDFDICVHAIAFAPREALQGDYLDAVDREAFAISHDVSSYSFAALGKAFRPMLKARAGAMLTLSYLGANRVVTLTGNRPATSATVHSMSCRRSAGVSLLHSVARPPTASPSGRSHEPRFRAGQRTRSAGGPDHPEDPDRHISLQHVYLFTIYFS